MHFSNLLFSFLIFAFLHSHPSPSFCNAAAAGTRSDDPPPCLWSEWSSWNEFRCPSPPYDLHCLLFRSNDHFWTRQRTVSHSAGPPNLCIGEPIQQIPCPCWPEELIRLISVILAAWFLAKKIVWFLHNDNAQFVANAPDEMISFMTGSITGQINLQPQQNQYFIIGLVIGVLMAELPASLKQMRRRDGWRVLIWALIVFSHILKYELIMPPSTSSRSITEITSYDAGVLVGFITVASFYVIFFLSRQSETSVSLCTQTKTCICLAFLSTVWHPYSYLIIGVPIGLLVADSIDKAIPNALYSMFFSDTAPDWTPPPGFPVSSLDKFRRTTWKHLRADGITCQLCDHQSKDDPMFPNRVSFVYVLEQYDYDDRTVCMRILKRSLLTGHQTCKHEFRHQASDATNAQRWTTECFRSQQVVSIVRRPVFGAGTSDWLLYMYDEANKSVIENCAITVPIDGRFECRICAVLCQNLSIRKEHDGPRIRRIKLIVSYDALDDMTGPLFSTVLAEYRFEISSLWPIDQSNRSIKSDNRAILIGQQEITMARKFFQPDISSLRCEPLFGVRIVEGTAEICLIYDDETGRLEVYRNMNQFRRRSPIWRQYEERILNLFALPPVFAILNADQCVLVWINGEIRSIDFKMPTLKWLVSKMVLNRAILEKNANAVVKLRENSGIDFSDHLPEL